MNTWSPFFGGKTKRLPDVTAVLNFRHLPEGQQFGASLFAKFDELLVANGMTPSGGTIVDVTLISAPPSVKNANKSNYIDQRQQRYNAHGANAVSLRSSRATKPWVSRYSQRGKPHENRRLQFRFY